MKFKSKIPSYQDKENINMNINFKRQFALVCICVLVSIMFLNCSTTSQIYLESARYTDDTTYGYSMSNPINLKYCKSFGNKKTIEEYISRLFTKDSDSFIIIESTTISVQKSNANQTDTEIIDIKSSKPLVSLDCYKIISEKGKMNK